MNEKITVDYDLVVQTFISAIDLMGNEITQHSLKVAYVAACIGRELGLSELQYKHLYYGALLHDCGVSTHSDMRNLHTDDWEMVNDHALRGSALLKKCDCFKGLHNIVKQHHQHYFQYKDNLERLPLESRIIFLADRMTLKVESSSFVLEQRDGIMAWVRSKMGRWFDPDLEAPLSRVAKRESFWFDIVNPLVLGLRIKALSPNYSMIMDLESLSQVATIFADIIDDKSSFTYKHSLGVKIIAADLAAAIGFSDRDLEHLKLAALLHDIGKLSIPDEILDKPAPLTKSEFNVMKQHTYHTHRILSRLPGFEEIADWAAYHHETLDGEGYPFKIPGHLLTAGSRVIAIADVTQALRQKRPYRGIVPWPNIFDVLDDKVANNKFDGELVDVLKMRHKEIDKQLQAIAAL